jgi:hypothetical protein
MEQTQKILLGNIYGYGIKTLFPLGIERSYESELKISDAFEHKR